MLDNLKDDISYFFDNLKRDKKRLIKVLLIVFILLFALVFRVIENQKSDVKVETGKHKETQIESIYVDIDGAVKNPGVYKVKSNTRLYEVIDKAGGLTELAATDAINRAEFVEDGQKITIPSRASTQDGASVSTETSGITENGLININTASKEELKQITGVGDVIADRIIEYRSKTRFKSIEDIMCVSGIGTATFEKMKSEITV